MGKNKTLYGATEDIWLPEALQLYNLANRELQQLYKKYKQMGYSGKEIKEIISAAAANCNK